MADKGARLNFKESAEYIAKHTKTLRIIRYFPDSDLRCGHEGLREVAKKNGVDPWELAPGEFLVFANHLKNKMKIYAPGNVIAYLKSPDNRRIDLDVVRLIPRFFNGTQFNYDAAVKSMVLKKMAA